MGVLSLVSALTPPLPSKVLSSLGRHIRLSALRWQSMVWKRQVNTNFLLTHFSCSYQRKKRKKQALQEGQWLHSHGPAAASLGIAFDGEGVASPKASHSSPTPFFYKKATFSLKVCSALIAKGLWCQFLITKLITSQYSRLLPQQISSAVLNKWTVWAHFSTCGSSLSCTRPELVLELQVRVWWELCFLYSTFSAAPMWYPSF